MQEDDSERDVTTYTVLVLEKSSVQISDLSPGTAYVFRVQALSPEGKPGSYNMEHEFKTLPMGRCPRNWILFLQCPDKISLPFECVVV